MSRIRMVNASAAEGQVAEILDEIRNAFGMIPNLFLTYAQHPPLLEANWHKVKRVMMEGRLSRKTKEAIAVLVSQDNGCKYCVAAHSGALKSIGVSADEIQKIVTNLDESDFSPLEKALIEFARKANSAPHTLSTEEFQAVKNTGADDAQIIEALGVMEVFTAFNKFLDTLDVELD